MPSYSTARRVAVLDAFIAAPPADVVPLQAAFAAMVARQWQRHVPGALADPGQGIADADVAKARFTGEMYARACYSMLLVSARGPIMLRLPVRATTLLPRSRALILRLGRTLLLGLDWLVPQSVHRQLLLTSALMGMLDVVLDEAAGEGEASVLRVSALLARPRPPSVSSTELPIAVLTEAARRYESAWQAEYWENVLQPAARHYCLAERLAVIASPDPKGLAHRWPGIDAAIKGMWYVIGPLIGLQGSLSRFMQSAWTPEQQWMADTSLLMQMIDDWADQDEDRGLRITPVVTGAWNPQSIAALHSKTVRDLKALLTRTGVRNTAAQDVFVDLYNDYLHTAMGAMRSGIAA
jgi:hypothetical protein